jgi:hypothetical protein
MVYVKELKAISQIIDVYSINTGVWNIKSFYEALPHYMYMNTTLVC